MTNKASDLYGPTGFSASLTHHDTPLQFKGAHTSWRGSTEHIVLRFVCECGLTAEVSTHELIGPPEETHG